MEPAFQYKKMRTLVPLFARCTRKLIAKWEKQLNEPVPVETGLTELTLDAIGMLWRGLWFVWWLMHLFWAGLGAFGRDFGAVDGLDEMNENLDHYHAIISSGFRPLAFILPVVAKLPTAYNKQLDVRIKKFQDFLLHVIKTHREGKYDGKDLDLLDHIIAMDEHGQLTNEEVHFSLLAKSRIVFHV